MLDPAHANSISALEQSDILAPASTDPATSRVKPENMLETSEGWRSSKDLSM
jgi:hypothetical protein